MWRCPQCGSSRLDQYRMPYGPMWCQDCQFRIEDKTITPNPFYVEDDNLAGQKPEKSNQIKLGQHLANQSKKGK